MLAYKEAHYNRTYHGKTVYGRTYHGQTMNSSTAHLDGTKLHAKCIVAVNCYFVHDYAEGALASGHFAENECMSKHVR